MPGPGVFIMIDIYTLDNSQLGYMRKNDHGQQGQWCEYFPDNSTPWLP